MSSNASLAVLTANVTVLLSLAYSLVATAVGAPVTVLFRSYLFCRRVNCWLVVKRRDSLWPLSCHLRESLQRGRGPKPPVPRVWHQRHCFGGGDQQGAAEHRPNPAGSAGQHLHRFTCQSRTHLEKCVCVCLRVQACPVPVLALKRYGCYEAIRIVS